MNADQARRQTIAHLETSDPSFENEYDKIRQQIYIASYDGNWCITVSPTFPRETYELIIRRLRRDGFTVEVCPSDDWIISWKLTFSILKP